MRWVSRRLLPAACLLPLLLMGLGHGAVGVAIAGDERLQPLPFEISVVAPFRVASVNGDTGVLLTVGEKDVDPKATQPQLLVTFTRKNASTGELSRIADVVLNAIGDNVELASRKEATIAGLRGLATRGTFDEYGTGKRFAHWLAPADGGVLQVLATAATDRYPALSTAIDQMARSIEMK